LDRGLRYTKEQAMTRTNTVAPPAKTAGITAAVGFLVIAVFQLALVLGLPLGRAAYGGVHSHLAPGYRIASAFAVVFWIVAALVVLRRAGVRSSPFSDRFARRATWALVVLSGVAALMNVASSSGWERFGWGPLAVVLGVLCFIVARSPSA
jgi:hypothetical protein